jgi:CRISPR-associated endonuclease Cas1
VFAVMDYPWVSVYGFGAYIKSTPKKLIIQKKDKIDEYPLDSVKNLLIVGGHNISSSTVNNLVKQGTIISFFNPDGSPVGIVRPFGERSDEEMYRLQQKVARHRYAIAVAQGSIKSRLFAIERIQETQNTNLFYEGELDFLHKSLDEISYLIKLDEIRRLHRLAADMYYEIISRTIPPEFGFRRRTIRPQSDPINAMFSFGYAMLFGNCCVSVIGARLDPDIGLLNDGKGSLVHDLIEPLKTKMIDAAIIQIAKDALKSTDYEQTPTRCMLSDDLIKKIIAIFQRSINNQRIDEQVYNFYNAITTNQDFKVLY